MTPATSAAITTAMRSLKPVGTTKRSIRYSMTTSNARKSKSQSSSRPMDEEPDFTSPMYTLMERLPRVRNTERVFEGRIFAVRCDEVEFEDGRRQRLDIVEHPGSFAIVACPDAASLVLVRQYRHPARAWLWELPAGKAESGEAPLEGAARELAEETGYRAERLAEIASFYVTPGFCEERLHLVLAEGLTAGKRHLDSDEEIEVRVVALVEATAMAARGEIIDAKTLIAILWLAGERTQLSPRVG